MGRKRSDEVERRIKREGKKGAALKQHKRGKLSA